MWRMIEEGVEGEVNILHSQGIVAEVPRYEQR